MYKLDIREGRAAHQTIVEARGRVFSVIDFNKMEEDLLKKLTPELKKNWVPLNYGERHFEALELSTFVSEKELPDGKSDIVGRYKTKAAAIAACNMRLHHKKVTLRERIWRIMQWVSKETSTI